MRKRTKPRPYDASGRRQRAHESQERMLEVARALFAEKGYVETTMDEIAKRAEVAVPTLYAAFGSKRAILSKLIDRLVSGEPGSPPILQTQGAQRAMSEPDRARALSNYAHHMRTILARVTPVHEMIKSAARSEPELGELFARMQKNRFANMEVLARSLADRGPLREGLGVEEAARTIWVLSSVEVRQLLVQHGGWSEERYETWLADTLVATLLP
jgi:AcrR family transcriptional regulator